MTLTYRPAGKEDSSRLAELIHMASDGVVEYLFHDLIPGMTPVQVVAHNLENDNYPILIGAQLWQTLKMMWSAWPFPIHPPITKSQVK